MFDQSTLMNLIAQLTRSFDPNETVRRTPQPRARKGGRPLTPEGEGGVPGTAAGGFIPQRKGTRASFSEQNALRGQKSKEKQRSKKTLKDKGPKGRALKDKGPGRAKKAKELKGSAADELLKGYE